jgi:hypothetical protein
VPISQAQLTALHAAFPTSRRNELARILTRARADLDHIMYALGSGTPSTVKRATVLQLALDGNAASEIATAIVLPEARVEQILENVIADGLPALYPSFSEQVAIPAGTRLWEKIEPMVRSLPPSRGVRTAAWNPAIVLDFLVNDGTLQDGSVGQITEVIKHNLDQNKEPPTFEYEDTAHQQGKPPTILASTFFFLLGPAMIAFGVFQLKQSSIAGLAVAGFGILWTILNGLGLFKQLQERSLLKKVLSLQAAKQSVATPTTQTASVAAKPQLPVAHEPLPPPPFTIGHVLSLPEVNWQIGALSDSANALGGPPTPVLYLWVFAAQSDQRGFETEGWPQIGPVHLLLNSTALTINKLADADKFLIADQVALDGAVAAYDDRAGTYPRSNLFMTFEAGSKNFYPGYPIHTLICTDGVWKPAFRQLAARSRIAIVNLSGFNPSHPGLEFEILHLLAGGPPTRFVFVYERTTDADAVIASVLNLWSHLDPPPATTPELHFLRIPESQDVGYALQFGKKMPRGFGWLGNIHLDREGPYTPIAGRILTHLKSYSD